jgi:hypothetical protein
MRTFILLSIISIISSLAQPTYAKDPSVNKQVSEACKTHPEHPVCLDRAAKKVRATEKRDAKLLQQLQSIQAGQAGQTSAK